MSVTLHSCDVGLVARHMMGRPSVTQYDRLNQIMYIILLLLRQTLQLKIKVQQETGRVVL